MAPKKLVNNFNFPNPIDNDYLVGHRDTFNSFLSAWSNRDKYPIHPVWMLTGPRGIGKATLAYKIAKNVYGNIGDFFIIDTEHNIDQNGKPKTDSKTITVHTVRAMIEKMQMSSMSGDWRVVIIDSVDQLNAQACNAILKLLEEPPEKTLFLLIVHQLSNVLPTIRSRARVEKMRPLTVNELRELCYHFMPDTEISNETLLLANGCFGRIANLKNFGGDIIYDNLLKLLKRGNCDSYDLMTIATKIAPTPELYGILLDVIAHFKLADLYPSASKAIADISYLNLEPETALFKIILDIKKCL